jgi:3-methyladenine DNA glycosylase AlkD
MNRGHREILTLIQTASGAPQRPSFLDRYLGNTHVKYNIRNPALRQIARSWVRAHADMTTSAFTKVVSSLVTGKSSTEKQVAGMLLDAARPHQRQFKPTVFNTWLTHVQGWAEVDTLCTGPYTADEVLRQWPDWKKLLTQLSKSSNVNKRRASLVFLCHPVRHHDNKPLAALAFANIKRLQHEKDVMITKAISWLLRSMVKLFKQKVRVFVNGHKQSLPAIAVRETLKKIKTGRKTTPRAPAGR